MLKRMQPFLIFTALMFISNSFILAQDDALPLAEIVNNEGGVVAITGTMRYDLNPLRMEGISEPLIILEDQAGFIDRNEYFLFPTESQVLAQITSDYLISPFTYSLSLPIEPQASLRDVDNDGEDDTGVMVFAIAYWENIFGDPLLEYRDQFGGGWSNAYASTRVSTEIETEDEIIGGKYLVYSPDDQQGFPSDFGEDTFLFTEDDPIVRLPQGYTVVDMDTQPFTFDRSRHQVIDLIEPEGTAIVDFSDKGITEAFEAMVELMRNEYAFTESKNIDWDALLEEFRPQFQEAEANSDLIAYHMALRDFSWAIPDGHMAYVAMGTLPGTNAAFSEAVDGGLGIAIRELDDGRAIVNFVAEGSPAEDAGIQLRAELLEINGEPINKVISKTVAWSAPFSTDHVKRLQQSRYAVRFPVGTKVEITYQNPDEEPVTTTLVAIEEPEGWDFSFNSIFSLPNGVHTGIELPVEFDLLDNGYGYVAINTFHDDYRFQVLLWERMIREMKALEVPGIIIDMRQNNGGSGFLADQMAAYFFDESLSLGFSESYDKRRGEFYQDPRAEERFLLPEEKLRYHGDIAVIIGPRCNSACEFFTYAMTLEDRATVIGHYPTAGLGGGQERFIMPLMNYYLQFSAVRTLDSDGNIIIEGTGIAPTVRIPVTEETLFSEDDVLLEAAVDYLNTH